MNENNADVKQVSTNREQLQSLLEDWYKWLTSEPTSLFEPQDVQKLRGPVEYLHRSNAWLSRTTLQNTQWFFEEGSSIVMNRWKRGEYDAYD